MLRIGIIGSGFIAGVMAEAISQTSTAVVVAVSSRHPENARAFAKKYTLSSVFDTWQELIQSEDVDAVYVATPTNVREEICVAAANARKHIFAEKPFASAASLQNIIDATTRNAVAFMDGTHFVHNPRTRHIKKTMRATIGEPRAVRSTFFYPFDDRENIRFDPEIEPLASIGDLGWYNMRAIVEFLDTGADIKSVAASCERDDLTGVIIRCAGLIEFEGGQTSTFDFGFNAGVILMDLEIIGSKGAITMDDFVLDWHLGFDFSDGRYDLKYTEKSALDEPAHWKTETFNDTKAQKIYMVENFVHMSEAPTGASATASARASVETQKLVDALWHACNS